MIYRKNGQKKILQSCLIGVNSQLLRSHLIRLNDLPGQNAKLKCSLESLRHLGKLFNWCKFTILRRHMIKFNDLSCQNTKLKCSVDL